MENKEYYKPLTGLRAIAAILVYFHHNKIKAFILGDFDLQGEMHIGVGIFFVLSGFLISNRYYNSIETIQNYFSYLFRRFARIYPVYFVLFFLLFVFKVRTTNLEYIFTNIFLTKGFYDDLKFNGISQSWSLTVEFCFYIIAPLFFIYIKRYGKRIFISSIIIFSILLFAFSIRYLDYNQSRFILIYTFWGRIFEFGLGGGLGIFLIESKFEYKLFKISNTYLGVTGIFIVLLLLTFIKFKFNYPFGLYHPFGILLNNLVLPIFIFILLNGLLSEENILSKILSHEIFQILGKSSYVFYLIHMGIFYDILIKIIPVIPIISVVIIFLILWLLSFIINKIIEEPVNKFLCKYA